MPVERARYASGPLRNTAIADKSSSSNTTNFKGQNFSLSLKPSPPPRRQILQKSISSDGNNLFRQAVCTNARKRSTEGPKLTALIETQEVKQECNQLQDDFGVKWRRPQSLAFARGSTSAGATEQMSEANSIQSKSYRGSIVDEAALAKVFQARREYTEEEVSRSSGIPQQWVSGFQELVEKENCILAARPVSPHATLKMYGGFPTKNFHVHGKSSAENSLMGSSPIIHGWITVDQKFSKARDVEQAARLSSALMDDFKKSPEFAQSGDLIVPQWLIDSEKKESMRSEKARDGSLMLRPPQGKKGPTLQAIPIAPHSPDLEHFTDGTLKDPNGQILTREHKFYRIQYNGKPIQVVYDPSCHLPMTADIDMLEIAYPLKDHSPDDKSPNPDVNKNQFQKLRPYASEAELAEFDKHEDPHRGNSAKRVNDMNDMINEKLNRRNRFVVHHNIDANSPYGKIADNLPATVFIPTALQETFGKIFIATTEEDLYAFYQIAKDLAYNVHPNPTWGKEFADMRRTEFKQNLKRFSESADEQSSAIGNQFVPRFSSLRTSVARA